MQQHDPVTKRLQRAAYRLACGSVVAANMLLPRRADLAVHYGGARVGNIGGPLVKVRRLSAHFPDTRFGFSAAYLLSNAPYLPGWALALLKLRGVPIVYNQNGLFYPAWFEGDWRAENARMAIGYHAADWVFYQSDFCRRSSDRFLGPRRGGGEVLYNAVDTSIYTPLEQAEPREGFTFLLTGKIGDHLAYRLTNAIGGLHHARTAGLDARLVIAGWVEAGALVAANKLVEELGLASVIRFIGAYTQEAAPAIYRAADAYIMTKHNDPCPNTVLEALASGLPVLYSASGGVPELVGEAAGVALACPEDFERVVFPEDAAVGAGMLRIAQNHSAMALAARQRAVAMFDIVPWIERHRQVFEALRAGHSPAQPAVRL
jgi:glycosyltransferase involved in cell wall biosynthesis